MVCCVGFQRNHLRLRPTVVLLWNDIEYLADVLMIFTLPATRESSAAHVDQPMLFVRWHKELTPAHPLPVSLTVLDDTYSIVTCDAVVRQALVVPQLQRVSSTIVPSDEFKTESGAVLETVVAVSLKHRLLHVG